MVFWAGFVTFFQPCKHTLKPNRSTMLSDNEQLQRLQSEMIDLQIKFEYQQLELSQLSDVVRDQADQLALVTEENRRLFGYA